MTGKCEGRSAPGARKEEGGSDENWEESVIHLLFIQLTGTEHLLSAGQCPKGRTEVEGICSEHILKGFVFYAKEFYILCLLFKHK